MDRQDRGRCRLADPNAIPPTASSYWVVLGWELTSVLRIPRQRPAKVQALIDDGIRTFVNLVALKQQDRERRQRMSPEQQQFVKGWLACLRGLNRSEWDVTDSGRRRPSYL